MLFRARQQTAFGFFRGVLYSGGAMDKSKSKPASKAPKKSPKTGTKVGRKSATAPAVRPYPVEPEVLELQQRRLKNAAAAGAHALRSTGAPKPATAPGSSSRTAGGSAEGGLPRFPSVRFVFQDVAATSVHVSGEFNQWSTETTPMSCLGEGRWEVFVALAPGRYQYKFIVNGVWIPDPLARENVMNEHGSLNSVIVVLAESNIKT